MKKYLRIILPAIAALVSLSANAQDKLRTQGQNDNAQPSQQQNQQQGAQEDDP